MKKQKKLVKKLLMLKSLVINKFLQQKQKMNILGKKF